MKVFSATQHSSLELPHKDHADYISLDPAYLFPDKVCQFPIYIYHLQRDHYVLFKSENDPIQQEKLDLITRDGQRAVYIPKSYELVLNHYLASNLDFVVEHPELPVEEKARQVYSVASSVLKTLFEHPVENQVFINISNQVAHALAEFVIHEPRAVYQLNQLRSYDYYTYTHSINVCVLCIGLLQRVVSDLSKWELLDFTRGALLHDIGKCDIPSHIINKRGSLTPSEWELMRSHTVKGYQRLRASEELSDESRQIALFHHESQDGSGYPTGITGDRIPLFSRLCKIVDVFDALTSRRPYKTKMSTFEALRLMTTEMRIQLDPELLKQFIFFLNQMGKFAVSS